MHQQKITYLLPLLLVGCATGGGFEPEVVSQPNVATSAANASGNAIIHYKKPEVPTDEDSAETGYVINVPIPKFLQKDLQDGLYVLDSANQTAVAGDSENITVKFTTVQEIDGGKTHVPREKTLSVVVTPSGRNYQWNYLSRTDSSGELGNGTIYAASGDFQKLIKRYKQDHAQIGLVYFDDNSFNNASATGGGDAFRAAAIFYQGTDKTEKQDIPSLGKFHYRGQWIFAHQVAANTQGSENNDGGVGPLGNTYPVDFTVDFTSKTLTGKLKTKRVTANSDEPVLDYDVTADIKGNNFFGIAKGNYYSRKNRSGQFLHGSSSADADVFGSFYGNQAAELAGRAMARDNAWAGVFAAKKAEEESSDLIAAGVLKFNGTHLGEFEKVTFNGNIKTLVVDGVEVPVNGCCDTNNAVRYGIFNHRSASDDSVTGGYFVQGMPTPNYQMPNTGSAEYVGYWYGYATVDNVGSVSATKLDARFSANFNEKSLTGKLYAKDQDIASDTPPVTINASIAGNHFSGNATIQNWRIDSSRDGLGNNQIISGSATVKGMFYGAAANELGGHFVSDSHDIGGVFGARQVESNK